MDVGSVSLIGNVRDNDEDSLLVLFETTTSEGMEEGRVLAAVADGMGGGELGEVASRIAVDVFKRIVGPLILYDGLEEQEIQGEMRKAFNAANSEILTFANTHLIHQMGTTITAMLLNGKTALIGNIGDSRTYVFDFEGRVKFRTKDHSYIQELLDSKQITERDAKGDFRRNTLTRVLGTEKKCDPDFYQISISPGDSILLCCDGLWSALEEKEIGETIRRKVSAQEIADTLGRRAVTEDGSDNVSLVVIKP